MAKYSFGQFLEQMKNNLLFVRDNTVNIWNTIADPIYNNEAVYNILQAKYHNKIDDINDFKYTTVLQELPASDESASKSKILRDDFDEFNSNKVSLRLQLWDIYKQRDALYENLSTFLIYRYYIDAIRKDYSEIMDEIKNIKVLNDKLFQTLMEIDAELDILIQIATYSWDEKFRDKLAELCGKLKDIIDNWIQEREKERLRYYTFLNFNSPNYINEGLADNDPKILDGYVKFDKNTFDPTRRSSQKLSFNMSYKKNQKETPNDENSIWIEDGSLDYPYQIKTADEFKNSFIEANNDGDEYTYTLEKTDRIIYYRLMVDVAVDVDETTQRYIIDSHKYKNINIDGNGHTLQFNRSGKTIPCPDMYIGRKYSSNNGNISYTTTRLHNITISMNKNLGIGYYLNDKNKLVITVFPDQQVRLTNINFYRLLQGSISDRTPSIYIERQSSTSIINNVMFTDMTNEKDITDQTPCVVISLQMLDNEIPGNCQDICFNTYKNNDDIKSSNINVDTGKLNTLNICLQSHYIIPENTKVFYAKNGLLNKVSYYIKEYYTSKKYLFTPGFQINYLEMVNIEQSLLSETYYTDDVEQINNQIVQTDKQLMYPISSIKLVMRRTNFKIYIKSYNPEYDKEIDFVISKDKDNKSSEYQDYLGGDLQVSQDLLIQRIVSLDSILEHASKIFGDLSVVIDYNPPTPTELIKIKQTIADLKIEMEKIKSEIAKEDAELQQNILYKVENSLNNIYQALYLSEYRSENSTSFSNKYTKSIDSLLKEYSEELVDYLDESGLATKNFITSLFNGLLNIRKTTVERIHDNFIKRSELLRDKIDKIIDLEYSKSRDISDSIEMCSYFIKQYSMFFKTDYSQKNIVNGISLIIKGDHQAKYNSENYINYVKNYSNDINVRYIPLPQHIRQYYYKDSKESDWRSLVTEKIQYFSEYDLLLFYIQFELGLNLLGINIQNEYLFTDNKLQLLDVIKATNNYAVQQLARSGQFADLVSSDFHDVLTQERYLSSKGISVIKDFKNTPLPSAITDKLSGVAVLNSIDLYKIVYSSNKLPDDNTTKKIKDVFIKQIMNIPKREINSAILDSITIFKDTNNLRMIAIESGFKEALYTIAKSVKIASVTNNDRWDFINKYTYDKILDYLEIDSIFKREDIDSITNTENSISSAKNKKQSAAVVSINPNTILNEYAKVHNFYYNADQFLFTELAGNNILKEYTLNNWYTPGIQNKRFVANTVNYKSFNQNDKLTADQLIHQDTIYYVREIIDPNDLKKDRFYPLEIVSFKKDEKSDYEFYFIPQTADIQDVFPYTQTYHFVFNEDYMLYVYPNGKIEDEPIKIINYDNNIPLNDTTDDTSNSVHRNKYNRLGQIRYNIENASNNLFFNITCEKGFIPNKNKAFKYAIKEYPQGIETEYLYLDQVFVYRNASDLSKKLVDDPAIEIYAVQKNNLQISNVLVSENSIISNTDKFYENQDFVKLKLGVEYSPFYVQPDGEVVQQFKLMLPLDNGYKINKYPLLFNIIIQGVQTVYDSFSSILDPSNIITGLTLTDYSGKQIVQEMTSAATNSKIVVEAISPIDKTGLTYINTAYRRFLFNYLLHRGFKANYYAIYDKTNPYLTLINGDSRDKKFIETIGLDSYYDEKFSYDKPVFFEDNGLILCKNEPAIDLRNLDANGKKQALLNSGNYELAKVNFVIDSLDVNPDAVVSNKFYRYDYRNGSGKSLIETFINKEERPVSTADYTYIDGGEDFNELEG